MIWKAHKSCNIEGYRWAMQCRVHYTMAKLRVPLHTLLLNTMNINTWMNLGEEDAFITGWNYQILAMKEVESLQNLVLHGSHFCLAIRQGGLNQYT